MTGRKRTNIKFSLFMTLYRADSPSHFQESFDSILNQTVLPSEIIIVQDGDVPNELAVMCSLLCSSTHIPTKVIALPSNIGHGGACNVAIEACTYELIAKMDSDDIAVNDRFEKQLAMFNNDSDLAICSGHVAEFVNNIDEVVDYRRVPIMHDEIITYLRRRSPFNHPAVMYKKSAIQDAGGYPQIRRSEDYCLWVNLLTRGHKGGNVNDILLYFRASDSAFKRKKSMANTLDSINMRLYALRHHAAGLSDVLVVSAAHIFLFVTPLFITKWFYRKVLR